MTDAGYLFRSHERETKRIARGSYNRKCGSKSKKCTLPQDRMTKGEWKKMNGEVVTVNIMNKLEWKKFTKLSKDLQEQYLNNLIDNYGARRKDIAEMFGINEQSLSNFTFRRKLKVKFKHGKKEASQDWLDFMSNDYYTVKELDNTPEPDPIVEEPKPEPAVEDKAKPAPALDLDISLKNMVYHANGQPAVIFTQILKLLDLGKRYNIRVDVWEPSPEAQDAIPF